MRSNPSLCGARGNALWGGGGRIRGKFAGFTVLLTLVTARAIPAAGVAGPAGPGKQTTILDVDRLGIDIGLRTGDKRTFAIAAIDEAGNIGARTRLVTVASKSLSRAAAIVPRRR